MNKKNSVLLASALAISISLILGIRMASQLNKPDAPPWYDTFQNCAPVTAEQRDADFDKANHRWKNRLFRSTTPGVDFWLEPIDDRLQPTTKIIRSRLGEAHRDLEACRSKMRKPLKIEWDTPIAEQESRKTTAWFRAALHHDSCLLPALNVDDIKEWYAPAIAQTIETEHCTIKPLKGPDGVALQLSCGNAEVFLVDSVEGCFKLNLIRVEDRFSDPVFVEQFGWQKYLDSIQSQEQSMAE